MYDRLMHAANEADTKSEYYNTLNAASGLDRDLIQAKANYFLGVSAGLRQAAFMLQIEEDLI